MDFNTILEKSNETCSECGSKLKTKEIQGHGKVTSCHNIDCKKYKTITKQKNESLNEKYDSDDIYDAFMNDKKIVREIETKVVPKMIKNPNSDLISAFGMAVSKFLRLTDIKTTQDAVHKATQDIYNYYKQEIKHGNFNKNESLDEAKSPEEQAEFDKLEKEVAAKLGLTLPLPKDTPREVRNKLYAQVNAKLKKSKSNVEKCADKLKEGAKAIVSDKKYLLRRKNKDGRTEETTYIGSLKNKPSGWSVVKEL